MGIGWFLVALPALLLIEGNTDVRHWFGELAPSLQGMIGSVVVLCAIPLLWPIYLALSWLPLASIAATHLWTARRLA